MKVRNITQTELAKRAGYKRQANISSFLNINKTGIRSDSLVSLLSAMDFELVARDKLGSGTEFIIDMKPVQEDAESENAATDFPEVDEELEEVLKAKRGKMKELISEIDKVVGPE